jgi:hypothetical protein
MKSLSQTLVQSGHDLYENILTVSLLSLLWFFLLAPAFFLLALPFAIFYLIFMAVPALAGVFYTMDQKLNRKPFSYKLFFTGFVHFYGRAFVYGLLISLMTLIVSVSWWYFISNKSLFTLMIAMFQSYFYLFVQLGLIYTLPTLVRKDEKLHLCMKESVRLFLHNSMYTIGSFIQILCIGALLLLTLASIPLLMAGVLSIILINIYTNLTTTGDKGMHVTGHQKLKIN